MLLVLCLGQTLGAEIIDTEKHTTFAESLNHKATPTATATTNQLKGRIRNSRGWKTSFLRNLQSNWTRKKSHDESDEEDCDHLREKHGITCTPSSSPSSAPSSSPTLSSAPSISSAPTSSPSTSPTRNPTREPSAMPTGAPSSDPTYNPTVRPSASPSRTPYASLVLTRDDGSTWQENTCQTSLPVGASAPQSEVAEFEYFLQVVPGSNVDVSLQEIEQALATELAEAMLSCGFENGNGATAVSRQGSSSSNNNKPFETYAISSLPMDARSSSKTCPPELEDVEGASCFSIHAGFTPSFFYRAQQQPNNSGNGLRNRKLQSTQAEADIVQVFGPVLQQILDSGTFDSIDNVVSTTYSGFLVNPAGVQEEYKESGGSISSISNQAATNEGSGGGSGDQIMYGGIAIGLAAVALVVVAAVLVQRRKDSKLRQNGEFFEKCEDDGADFSIGDDSKDLPESYPNTSFVNNRSGDVEGIEIEGFPVGGSVGGSYAASGNASVQSRSMASARLPLGSIDESSIAARETVKGLRYGVVNDEATVDDGSLFGVDSILANDPHDYVGCRLENCFKCRTRQLPQPTFVQADLQAIQSDLGSNKRYRPKYDRQYQAEDTVEL